MCTFSLYTTQVLWECKLPCEDKLEGITKFDQSSVLVTYKATPNSKHWEGQSLAVKPQFQCSSPYRCIILLAYDFGVVGIHVWTTLRWTAHPPCSRVVVFACCCFLFLH